MRILTLFLEDMQISNFDCIFLLLYCMHKQISFLLVSIGEFSRRQEKPGFPYIAIS
jgi:hypothetical protein